MKVAIITDTHWGVRNDSPAFYRYFEKFYSKVFFPYLKKNKITTVLHLGDLVDRRKYINFNTAKHVRSLFIEPMTKQVKNFMVTVGNHDCYYKNTNDINAIKELFGKYPIKIYTDPAEIDIDGLKILLVPWICQDNQEKTLKMIKETSADVLAGHLELNGFEMHRGMVSDHGMDRGVFSKFDIVLSGHYHTKSSSNNIHYLGAPCEFIWSDYDDPRGFHVLDTKTREIEFIQNPYSIFKKIYYNDDKKSLSEVVENFDYNAYSESIVKLSIIKKTNPYFFDMFVTKLEEAGIEELKIIDENINQDLVDDADLVVDSENTLDVFNKHIEQMDDRSLDKDKLVRVVHSLYNDALRIE